jgi:hypothetical protein
MPALSHPLLLWLYVLDIFNVITVVIITAIFCTAVVTYCNTVLETVIAMIINAPAIVPATAIFILDVVIVIAIIMTNTVNSHCYFHTNIVIAIVVKATTIISFTTVGLLNLSL